MANTLILLYHDIVKQTKNLHIYDVSLNAFKEQMELLKVLVSDENKEMQSYRLINGHNCALTFDDGYRVWAQEVLEILKASKLKAYFFICIKNINDASILKQHIKTLHENGMIIGSHSVTHRFMHQLTEKEIYDELEQSKKALEDIIGQKVLYFSVPRGVCNESVLQIAKEVGYKHVFTSQIGSNETLDYALQRIAIKRDTRTEDFKAILDGTSLDRMVLEQNLKDKAKKVLGIDLYNRLRRIFIPRAEKQRI